MDSVARVLFDIVLGIVFFAFLYPYPFIGLLLLLLVGIILTGVRLVVRYRNKHKNKSAKPRRPQSKETTERIRRCAPQGGRSGPGSVLGPQRLLGYG